MVEHGEQTAVEEADIVAGQGMGIVVGGTAAEDIPPLRADLRRARDMEAEQDGEGLRTVAAVERVGQVYMVAV